MFPQNIEYKKTVAMELSGQRVTGKAAPISGEYKIASFDGEMIVRVMKTDEISLNGITLCDHIQMEGEKINEYLFEATKLEVEEKKKC